MQAPENAVLAASLLFAAMLAVLEIGRRHGARRAAANVDGARPGGAVYVIVDLEYPRFGLIRVDAFDRVLVDLRRSMQ
ncbi:MAG TPA: hypothetical protein VMT79_09145 [Candidatus Binatia bacterium]|nr:hypothetical protein [Candidatus Binatia bacterium]